MSTYRVTYWKWFVLGLYILYSGSVLFSSHVHVDEWGMYVHAHPFTGSGSDTSHSHTSLPELLVIQQLSFFDTEQDAANVCVIYLCQPSLFCSIYSYDPGEHTECLHHLSSLRAPPFA